MSSFVSTMLTDWSNKAGVFPRGDLLGLISTFASCGGGSCLSSEADTGVFDLDRRVGVVFLTLDDEGGAATASSLVSTVLTDWSSNRVVIFPLGDRFGFISTIDSSGRCSSSSEVGLSMLLNSAISSSPTFESIEVSKNLSSIFRREVESLFYIIQKYIVINLLLPIDLLTFYHTFIIECKFSPPTEPVEKYSGRFAEPIVDMD